MNNNQAAAAFLAAFHIQQAAQQQQQQFQQQQQLQQNPAIMQMASFFQNLAARQHLFDAAIRAQQHQQHQHQNLQPPQIMPTTTAVRAVSGVAPLDRSQNQVINARKRLHEQSTTLTMVRSDPSQPQKPPMKVWLFCLFIWFRNILTTKFIEICKKKRFMFYRQFFKLLKFIKICEKKSK